MTSSHRKWPKHREAEHAHENTPPAMQKFPGSWDNDGAAGSAVPVDSPLVTDGRKNSQIGASLTGNYMRPVYDDAHDSAYIHDSQTDSQKHGDKE
jgi:hypothetical protein